MELHEAETLARSLISEHLSDDWQFAWHERRSAHGSCSHSDHTIALSRVVTPYNDPDKVRDTVLHEIAHAKVGPGNGHNRLWKTMARAIGADPTRGHKTSEPMPHKWHGVCDVHGVIAWRDRLSQSVRRASCPKCSPVYSPEFQLRWERGER